MVYLVSTLFMVSLKDVAIGATRFHLKLLLLLLFVVVAVLVVVVVGVFVVVIVVVVVPFFEGLQKWRSRCSRLCVFTKKNDQTAAA